MTPLVVIPARFSESASALRYGAIVTARLLSEAVLRAGGEPLTVHPTADVTPHDIARRFAFADAVLLPGGGDIAPERYGQTRVSDEVYDVNAEQDAFDLAVARWALESGTPLLAICRGLQVVNVALGGTLQQDMGVEGSHRHVVHDVQVTDGTRTQAVLGAELTASCFHHQRIDALGAGLRVSGRAGDGTVEAIESDSAPGWFLGVQWHPEDTAAQDTRQQRIFDELVAAASRV